MPYQLINYSKEDGVGIIVLKRPAMNSQLIDEIDGILTDIEKDDEVRAVIFTGSEKAFALGGDIKELSDITSPVTAYDFIKRVRFVYEKIESFEKPVIAAMSGLALGGGCELSLVCDIRIAADNTVFGQPEIKLGVIPGAGGTQRLTRLVGITHAKMLLYTGDTIDANEAYRVGLVNKIVPLSSLLDEAKKVAKKIARQPGFAQKMMKSAINNGINMDIKSAVSFEARCFEMLFATEDKKEGMEAFIEKRRPVYKNR